MRCAESRVWLVAGTLLTLGPVSAAAQRSEIALFGGAYRPTAMVREGPTGIECDDLPCPYYFRDVRSAGTVFGGRVTLFFGSHMGLDITVQYTKNMASRTLSQSPGWESLGQFDRHETTTFFAVQPRRRFELADGVHAAFALGPAFGNVTGPWGSSDGSLGVAGSVAVQIQITRAIGLELRGSGLHVVGRGLEANRTHLAAGAGLALAVFP